MSFFETNIGLPTILGEGPPRHSENKNNGKRDTSLYRRTRQTSTDKKVGIKTAFTLYTRDKSEGSKYRARVEKGRKRHRRQRLGKDAVATGITPSPPPTSELLRNFCEINDD